MYQVKFLTRQQTDCDRAESYMEGGFASSSSGYAHNTPTLDSSKRACTAPEPPNCPPPQTIRVVRFPKKDSEPVFVWKQIIDVKADQHQGDAKLGHIPDFREDWGDGEKWELHRRAYCVYVAPKDIPEIKLHGWYGVFATYDPSYEKNTHKFIEGYGRHVHEDFFITKIGTYRDGNGPTIYVDMPDEFLSARTKNGSKLHQMRLAETNNSMIGPLLGW